MEKIILASVSCNFGIANTLEKHQAGQHDQSSHGSWALDRFDRPDGYDGLNVPAGELPDTVYHVTSSKNDQAISAGGLHAHAENTWNTGAGSYNKYEDNWIWGKGEDGQWQKEEYRPVGVYVFGSLNSAKNYAQSGNSIYAIDTKTTLADGADVIRDPSWSENWDYMDDPESEQAWVFNNVPVGAISLVMQKHQAGNHDQESHGSWAVGSDGMDTDYRMSHRPPDPEDGAPAHDLTGGGLIYPDNVYSADGARIYGGGEPEMARRVHSIITSMRGNPNAKVQIYRAVPKGTRQVNVGDWVTIDREYAEVHGQSNLNNDYDILSNTVNADEIYTDGNSLYEWSYHPRVQKHQAGQHDQTTHGSWATANGYKPALEEDLPALESMNYDSTLRYARDNYIARGYTWMNEYLRDGYIADTVEGIDSESEPISQEEAISLVESLKSALYKTQTTQDLTVTRWTRTGESIIGEKISDVSNLKSLIGKTYHAKGFTSTSVEPDSSTTDGYKSVSKVLANIHMPAGTYGATVYNSRESEFLLPPDTFFVVMGVNDIGEGRISLDLLVTGQGNG